ncbi:MAG: HD domain-containing protein [Candidatus Nitrosothermus koennekii]|nr:MAG: HD domain-containing protein [Candidatus Nitrosothermus koennekii]
MDILKFIKIANKLKSIKRKGWIAKAKVEEKDAESVADHSYQTALITMLLADMKGYDSCKAIKLALIHDLAEAIVGDYMPEEISNKKKHEEENDAIDNMLTLLPSNIREEYKHLWLEYINNTSKEADLVHQIDKLEMIIQADEYKHKGYSVDEFYASMNLIRDKDLRDILNNLK